MQEWRKLSMVVNLSPETHQLIEKRMKASGFTSADEAIRAALLSWEQAEAFDDFAPGELDALIAEGEESYRKEGGFTQEEVFGPIFERLGQDKSPE
jgi:Arc/MetJ-type ribon-helix-helix transcriptional regulator